MDHLLKQVLCKLIFKEVLFIKMESWEPVLKKAVVFST